MLDDLKNTLRELIKRGKFDELFQYLEDNLKPDCGPIKEARQLETRYTIAKKAFENGLIDFAEKAQVDSQVSFALYALVEDIKDVDLKTKKDNTPSSPIFGLHHQYTCDRGKQYQPFQDLLEKKLEKPAKPTSQEKRPHQHFFYLFGGEAQAHNGIFQRFVNRLKGIHQDYQKKEKTKNTDGADPETPQKSGFNVCDFLVSVPCLEDVNSLKTELPRLLLYQLGVNDKAMEQMEEKNLAFGLKQCPQLIGFKEDDKVCFHISITEAIWDKEVVPELARAFVEDFCFAGLDKEYPEHPELFFFFSVEYDDDHQDICDEIEEALARAKYLSSLGELKMVMDEHINNWFLDYKDFWEDPDDRKATKIRHFGEKSPPLTMVKVQKKLREVINEINIKEKYEHRNS